MPHGASVLPDDRFLIQDEAHVYFCPVCGEEVSLSNFLTPEREYYCPYCATRQTPSLL
jgi:DNA-directed RNA polymerase subunit RPC12/RpoP